MTTHPSSVLDPRKKRRGAPIVGVLAFVLLLGALLALALRQGRSQDPALAGCNQLIAEFVSSDPSPDLPVVHLLVDPESNDRAKVGPIAAALSRVATAELESGPARLKLIVSPGAGAVPVIDGNCLDGQRAISVSFNNADNAESAIQRVQAGMKQHLEDFLVQHTVLERGGPETLLQQASVKSDRIDHVVLWSDLLSNDGGCLDGEGKVASAELSRQLVERCDAQGLLDLPDTRLTLTGVASSARSLPFLDFSQALAEQICAASETSSCQIQ